MPRSPEQGPAPQEEKEAREPKVEFDWSKHLKKEISPVEGKDWIHELKSLVIEGPKGSVDVLEFTDAKKVYIKPLENESGGFADYVSDDVVVEKFEDLGDLVTLMHELGHVRQKYAEDFDQELDRLAIEVRILKGENDPGKRVEIFKQVLRTFPKAVELIKSGTVTEEQAMEIIKIPLKITERDATARAFKWLRKISQKTGIDFFGEFQKGKGFDWEKEMGSDEFPLGITKQMYEHKVPNQSPERFINTTIVKEMNDALATYRAETLTDTYDPGSTGDRLNIKPKTDDNRNKS